MTPSITRNYPPMQHRALDPVAMWEDPMTGHDRLATINSGGDIEVREGEAFTVLRTLNSQTPTARILLVPFTSAEGRTRLLLASRNDRAMEVWDPRGGHHAAARPLCPDGPLPTRPIISPVINPPKYHAIITEPSPNRHSDRHLFVTGWQVWDPEEGVLLPEAIPGGGGPQTSGFHLIESAEGRYLLAVAGYGAHSPWHATGEAERTFLDVWDLGEAPLRAQHVRPANKQG
jgi:hypothetical protein